VLIALRSVDRAVEVARAARTLAVVVVVQGTIGFVQYFTELPVVLVGMHLFGAALFAAAMTWLLLSAQDAGTAGATRATGPPEV
jgi:cytochrome c oxidase assembly protein subunit 15